MCRQFVQCGSPSDTSAFFQVYSLKNGLVVSRGVRFRVTDLMGNANHDPHGPLPTDSLHFETCVGPGCVLGWAFMPCTGPQTLTKLSLLMLIWGSLISHSVSNPFLTSAFVYVFVPPSLLLLMAWVHTCGDQRKISKASIIFHLSFPTYSLDTGVSHDLEASILCTLVGQWAPDIFQGHKTIAWFLNKC